MRLSMFMLVPALGATASPFRFAPSQDHQYKSTTLPSLLQPRQEHSVAALNNRIYMVGGILSDVSYSPGDPVTGFPNITTTASMQYFDVHRGCWLDAATVPVKINHGNIATLNGKLYLLGGLSGENLLSWDSLDSSFEYDPTRDEWSSIASIPQGMARGASAVGVYGDEIYLAGGMDKLELKENGTQGSVSSVISYNVRTDSWTTNYPPLPGPRDHVAGTVIGKTFYVTGGRDHNQFNWKNDTWALDLSNPTAWVAKAPMITARGGLASARIGDKLYTFGGEGNPSSPDLVFDNVEVYDATSDVWAELPRMSWPRHGMGAAAIGGRIYVPGGGVRISAAPTNHFDVFEFLGKHGN